MDGSSRVKKNNQYYRPIKLFVMSNIGRKILGSYPIGHSLQVIMLSPFASCKESIFLFPLKVEFMRLLALVFLALNLS